MDETSTVLPNMDRFPYKIGTKNLIRYWTRNNIHTNEESFHSEQHIYDTDKAFLNIIS